MKISFCSTCKGRLFQLEKTIFNNMSDIIKDGNSELILVDYNDNEGLEKFVRDNLMDYINSNVLVYIKEAYSDKFDVSRAKNLAHFAANGDFLFNLDGDNYIDNNVELYRSVWTKYPNAFIHAQTTIPYDGSYGRIGMSRRAFLELGGYDEDIGVRYEDADLLKRSILTGLLYAKVSSDKPLSIRNTLEDSTRYTDFKGKDAKFCHIMNKRISDIKLLNGELIRNINRQKAKVVRNFKEEVYI
jgi:glycosyltransferase involved in cell wall biosynthesis